MEKGILIRALLKELVTLAVFYFIMKLWWGNETWFIDKSKELLFFAAMGVVYFIASFFMALISRPIKIHVSQKNAHFDENKTNFSIRNGRKTQEHERTVSATILINRKKSIWGWLALKIVNRYELLILFEPVTPCVILQADRGAARSDVDETTVGFKLKFSNYISSIVANSSIGSFSKSCDYTFVEDNRNIGVREVTQVLPRLVKNDGRDLPRFLTLFLAFDNSDASHTVNFKWE